MLSFRSNLYCAKASYWRANFHKKTQSEGPSGILFQSMTEVQIILPVIRC